MLTSLMIQNIFIIVFAILGIPIFVKWFAIRGKSKWNLIRIILCIITAGIWAGKIIISSEFTGSSPAAILESRLFIRLFRVFVYAGIVLCDYKVLLRFLRKHSFLLLLAAPVVSFVQMETMIGTSIGAMSISYILKNLLLLTIIYLFFFIVFEKFSAGVIFTSLLIFIISVANYFVFAFRGRYIRFSDIYEFSTAMDVVGKYSFQLGKSFVLAAGILMIILLPAAFVWNSDFSFARMIRCRNRKWMLPIRMLFASGLCFLFVFLIKSDVLYGNVKSMAWAPEAYEKKYGYLLSFVAEIHDSSVKSLDGYSVETANQILEQTAVKEKVSEKSPNIIVIMNESFTDLSVLGDFSTNQEYMPFYNSLSENTIRGYQITSGIGGGTSQTEFEFLSGCSQAFISGSVYARYLNSDTPSIVTSLQNQKLPYRTIAMHPEKATNYYRDRAYRYLGFDETYFIDSFPKGETVFDKVTDAADYDFLIQKYEEEEKEGPLFIMDITMQNHGDYTHSDYDFEDPVNVTSFQASDDVNEFLTLMKMSDDALAELIGYFDKIEEPTIILFFGDHQPSLSDSFYETVMGKTKEELSPQEEMKKYMVPFMLWANYDIEEKQGYVISPNILSPLLLDTAGLQLTSFNRFVLQTGEQLPVIQSIGYMDANRTFFQYNQTTEYEDLLQQYKVVQYNYLYDVKNRLNQYYLPQ